MSRYNFWRKNSLILALLLMGASCSHVDNPPKSEEEKAISDVKEVALEEELEQTWSTYQKDPAKLNVELIASELFFKANDASVRGDSETASQIYSYLIRFKPEDTFLKKQYAIELVRTGMLEDAQVLLSEVVLKQEYKEETTALLWGGVLTALGKEKKATGVYSKLLTLNPSNEEACIFLAKRLGLEGKISQAHKKLKVCESKSDGKGIFSYYRGKLALKQNNYKLARKLFRKSLKIEKDFYQSALALGLIYEEEKKYKAAVAEYKKYLKNDPQSYAILSRLVQLKFSREDYDGIIPYAEQLSALDQSDLNLKVKLGILYSDAKKYTDAIGVFKEVLTVVPDSDKVLYYIGSLYRETSDNESALETFGKINEESSLYLDSTMQVAQILKVLVGEDQGKWESNYISFLDERRDKAKELRVEMGVLKANYMEENGRYGEAVSSLEPLRSDKSYTENHDYYLASLYEKLNEREAARSLISKMLDKNPDNAHALNYIGYSLLEEGQDFEKAYSYIFKAVQLSPKDGYIRDSLAWYFYKVGNYKQALVEIKKASHFVQDDVVINKHMGMIYTKLNNYKLAREFFTKALKFCDIASERKLIQKALDQVPQDRLPASH